jgi:Zn-dependent protease with chaperone function
MDFFEHQEKARRHTHVLVVYFALAIVGIIASIYGVAVGLSMWLGERDLPITNIWWQPELLIPCAAGTALVIFLASTFKTLQLSGGGGVVARELGGRPLDGNTTDYHERRLLNVVEEMAIAAGVPVPTVYLLDQEDAVNAFAAGRSTSDAVIGVTRGCCTLLTRDELQGVVAHEFSHILNGDMRLNIRLMGLLYGILFLALMGELILRFGPRSSSNSKEGNGLALVMVITGLALLVIGHVGAFFAGLIKASVSRQREFLADASAVQFTRNPDGIAGALKKIGGLSAGSKIGHPMARDASHLFFGSALKSNWFATHPPLTERISRLLPHWDGVIQKAEAIPVSAATDERLSGLAGATAAPTSPRLEDKLALTADQAIESFRSVHPEQVALGRSLHAALHPAWIDACHSREGAQVIVYALLLSPDPVRRQQDLTGLQEATHFSTDEALEPWFQELHQTHGAVKLALVDLAIASLRQLSPVEYQSFRKNLDRLVSSDGQVDLFEFALLQVVTRHLDTFFRRRPPARVAYTRHHQLRNDSSVLLSTLAHFSQGDGASGESAFRHAIEKFPAADRSGLDFLPASDCSLDRIEASLNRYEQAAPPLKRDLLEAASVSVLADGVVCSREAELIRAIADAIGCPIPPFVQVAPLVDL